jgi:hypothetical protein
MARTTKKSPTTAAQAQRPDLVTEAQAAATADIPPTIELGASGLQRYSGVISEEFLRELKGRLGVIVYKEMRDNDPVVGAMLFAFTALAKNVSWHVQAASEKPDDVQFAQFLTECMDDMEYPWIDFIDEVCSMYTFGWSWHEQVFKVRDGMQSRDPSRMSRFTDRKYGWRRIPLRAQETLLRWEFSENGDVLGMTQQAPPSWMQVTMPISKSVHFRTTSYKGNPEGRSVLRNAYRPWYYKKRLEEIEAIGIERDLAGLPVVKIPGKIMKGLTAEDRIAFENYKAMITRIRRDTQEGVVMPSDRDASGNLIYELSLLTTGGSRRIDTTPIIERKMREVAMCCLADFILIGHEKVGSFALADSKTSIFSLALNSFLTTIKNTVNRQMVPTLRDINGFRGNATFEHGDVADVNLNELADYVAKLANIGMELFPDDDLENHFRKLAKLPAKNVRSRDVEAEGGDLDGGDKGGDDGGASGDTQDQQDGDEGGERSPDEEGEGEDQGAKRPPVR